jgi:branched-chain amino acid transport system ATP-binding protein/urea transport system ATP-binding protein
LNALLHARGVVKRFGPLRALDGVDLDAREGAIHALVGPNGSGKSTLLGVLAGRLMPDRGSVELAARDITGHTPARRAREGVALKHQVASVFDELTVGDNVTVALLGGVRPRNLLRRGDPRVAQARGSLLERFELAALADRPAADLAHGERQWLELAMVTARRPRLLLLDEPTAGMSAQERARAGAILRELRARCAIVLVEHDLDWVTGLCDTVTVLVQGQVLAAGTPGEVKRDPAVREAFVARA